MFEQPYEYWTWIPYLELLLRLAVGVAWPIAFLVAALKLGPPIIKMLGRLRKISAAGLELSLGEQSLPDEQSAEERLRQPEHPPNDAAILERLRHAVKNVSAGINPQDRMRWFEDQLSIALMEKHFAIIYANIFGSQIRALQDLLDRGGFAEGLEVVDFFDQVKIQNPALEAWTVSQYLDFPIKTELIERRDGGVAITETGKLFLRFLAVNNLPRNRLN